MTTQQIRSEIQEILSSFEEKELLLVLSFLKRIIENQGKSIVTAKNLGKLLYEDHSLLQKLAR